MDKRIQRAVESRESRESAPKANPSLGEVWFSGLATTDEEFELYTEQLNFLALIEHPEEPGMFYWIPADTCVLCRSWDIKAELTLRPGLGFWARNLPESQKVGEVSDEPLEQAADAVRRMAAGKPLVERSEEMSITIRCRGADGEMEEEFSLEEWEACIECAILRLQRDECAQK